MLTPQHDQLALLLERHADDEDTWVVPWDTPDNEATLEGTANIIAQRITGTTPAWMEQVGAFGDGKKHPSDAEISIAFAALAPLGTPAPEGSDYAWFKLDALPPLAERDAIMVASSVAAVRDRMDLSPVAFRLLPSSFTLSELQQMYELLLGKRLHKASFRRALQAAWLVEPTDEWRSEGRGRPAQLYRYAPKKRRKGRRGVRFDLLIP
jgi:8-oxo-dGTP diphosphatase